MTTPCVFSGPADRPGRQPTLDAVRGTSFLARAVLLMPIALVALADPALAQVTVYDAPNEVHFAATVDTLRLELDQVRTLSSSVNGLRDLGAELKSLSVSTVLPRDLTALYAALSRVLPAAGASGCVARDAASQALCQLDANKTATEQQLAASLYAEAPYREQQLGALQTALFGAADLKTSSDLNARTAIAGASLENQRLQVELFALQSALQDLAIAKARRADQLARVLTPARAIDSLAPPNFEGGLP